MSACELCRPDVAEWIQKQAGEAEILRHLASYAALYTSYSIDLICHALDEVGLRRYLTTRESNESLPLSGASVELLAGVEPSSCSANSWQLCSESAGHGGKIQGEGRSESYQKEVYRAKKNLLSDLNTYHRKVASQYATILGGGR